MRTMWKAAVSVLLLLLLNTDMQVNGAVDKTRGSVAENPRPERKVKAGEAEAANTLSPTGIASAGFLGNLLVVPMDGSHWVGVKAIAQEMGRRGHRVTVVIPEISIRMGPGKHYDTVTFPVPYDMAVIDIVMSKNKDVMRKSAQSFTEKIRTRYSQIKEIVGYIHTTAESLLFNDSLISHLAQQNFDAILTDPMIPTGSLIARKLGIPTINLLRGIPCSLDMKSAGCPSPPSYVPRFLTRYTDKMSFKERTVNTMVALFEPLLCRLMFWYFDQMAYRFLGEEVGVAEVLSDSAIWLLRTDFTLEFPRPLMPNVVLVGGINCNVRNPLPEDLESWLSGEHGFVVFTLGTMVSDMPEETTSVFLETFRQIPQKVIWRYTGKVPDSVPENVKLMEWVPQNDLLAHSGARAFITHAGSHSLFEGLCHGVPMVMVPIGGDQPDNAERFASRKAGVVLDISMITTEILLQGLNEVINNTSYKENIQKLSALHKDRPVDPLDLSVYWTEYVMRHKGAKHLRSAVHDLNWLQYFCLDVIALLATVVLVFVILSVKCLKLFIRKLSRKRKLD
ncbi:UDP-glucuronosyltransferase 1A1-like [Anoplopoma fimbria]|uniref:UDP-glucuronosyltransferase 1A1-like n=1 Tax=Anoplopoma fimbria TaxID=229290 RepID=UPI0023EB75E2|nr:UDP-glucuronosyltransferase 1A1-like [Anoplopoma fimbria]